MLIFNQNLSTISEVKFRARDDVFWIRLTISILVGYLFSVAWAFMSFAIFLRIVVLFEDLFNTYGESGAKFDAMIHFISLISSPIIGLFMAIFAATPMLLSFVATLPIAITMGLCLRTSRKFVMLCSSLTGSLIGLPILLLSTGMIGNTNRHMNF